MLDYVDPNPFHSPFGPTGQGSFGEPTTHSTDLFSRDVYSHTTLTGFTTTETRDHLGNVLDRKSGPSGW